MCANERQGAQKRLKRRTEKRKRNDEGAPRETARGPCVSETMICRSLGRSCLRASFLKLSHSRFAGIPSKPLFYEISPYLVLSDHDGLLMEKDAEVLGYLLDDAVVSVEQREHQRGLLGIFPVLMEVAALVH